MPIIPVVQGRIQVGLSFTEIALLGAKRPTDLDLACLAIGPTGLIIDVVSFDKKSAFDGAMLSSGDKHIGDPKFGMDESIIVDLQKLPNYTYALIFCFMKSGAEDTKTCSSAKLHIINPDENKRLGKMAHIDEGCGHEIYFSTLAICRRVFESATPIDNDTERQLHWSYERFINPYGPHIKHFLDGDMHKLLISLLNIDRQVAEVLRPKEPAVNLVTNEQWKLPMGLDALKVAVGWEASSARVDIDVAAILLDHNANNTNTIYFGNKDYFNGIILHRGDKTAKRKKGEDCAQILFKMNQIPSFVNSIFIVINIFNGGTFKTGVPHQFCRLVDLSDGLNQMREIARFDNEKVSETGDTNGLVLLALHRNPSFPRQWVVSPACSFQPGRVCTDLVPGCQKIQSKFLNDGVIMDGSREFEEKKGEEGVLGEKPSCFKQLIKVSLVSATDLPPNRRNPYVKIRSVQNGTKVVDKALTTEIHKNSHGSATWAGAEIVLDSLGVSEVKFKAHNKELIGRDQIGEATLKLDENIDYGPERTEMALDLLNKKGESRGKLNIVITKLP